MTAAEKQLRLKISGMSDEMILASLVQINKPFWDYTPEERKVRTLMLNQYEVRHGVPAVDALMDKLEEMEVAVA